MRARHAGAPARVDNEGVFVIAILVLIGVLCVIGLVSVSVSAAGAGPDPPSSLFVCFLMVYTSVYTRRILLPP
jgi:hypothetical protein